MWFYGYLRNDDKYKNLKDTLTQKGSIKDISADSPEENDLYDSPQMGTDDGKFELDQKVEVSRKESLRERLNRLKNR